MPLLSDAALKRGLIDIDAVKRGLRDTAAGGGGLDDLILEDTPLRFYKLNEDVSASNAVDEGSGGVDASYLGSPILGADAIVAGTSQSVDFNGAGRAEAAALGSLPGISIEATFVVDRDLTAAIQTVCHDGGQFRIEMNHNGPTFYGWVIDNSGTAIAEVPLSNLTEGQVHHAVVTHGGTIRLYLDGTEIASQARTFSNVAAGTGMALGARAGGLNSLRGRGARMAIYNYALTPERVLEHANVALGV